jgi:AhpD family alkylhydroperoxidase
MTLRLRREAAPGPRIDGGIHGSFEAAGACWRLLPRSAEAAMSIGFLVEYDDASPEARAVFDDIASMRGIDPRRVNNFWKAMARHPAQMRRLWSNMRVVMSPGALDMRTKEMVYLAVSVTNNCEYCIASHTAQARKAGMTEEMFGELMAVVGLANETNRLANGYRVPVDEAVKVP